MAITIYCDESGFTGANLLESNQPYFVYCGIKLTEEEKIEINSYIRDRHVVQSKELKCTSLLKTDNGKKLILEIFKKYSKHARIIYCDKKYTLACKIFEYAIEPNLKSNYSAYSSGFHVYISNCLYRYFVEQGEDAEQLFRKFLNTLRGEKKESIFDFEHNDINSPVLEWVFDIVKYNPEVFYNEITTEGKIDGWILDLTSTCLWGILSDWGKNDPLRVICDNSNVFKDNFLLETLNKMGEVGNRTEILDITVGFKLEENIITKDSKLDVGIQVADIFSSTVSYALRNKGDKFSKEILKIMFKNCLCHPATFCVTPDLIEPTKKQLEFYSEFMKDIYIHQRS